jgi:ferredoxin
MQSELEVKLKGIIIMALNVWIDQNLCTGDGLCAEICPGVFVAGGDGKYYVKEFGSETKSGEGGPDSKVIIPSGLGELVVEAAEECPGGCIFIEKV